MRDEPETVDEGQWHMWALLRTDHEGAPYFSDPGDRRFALAHVVDEHPPVPVCVAERPKGRYWGWLADGEQIPCMIQPRWAMFAMCFPYGPEREQQEGRGRILQLHITARSAV